MRDGRRRFVHAATAAAVPWCEETGQRVDTRLEWMRKAPGRAVAVSSDRRPETKALCPPGSHQLRLVRLAVKVAPLNVPQQQAMLSVCHKLVS